MPLTNVSNDPAAKTITLTAEFDAPVERAWQLYADPRQLEQWWNPPGYPLTITDHNLSVGGMVRAHVTTPDPRLLADHRRRRTAQHGVGGRLPRRPARAQPGHSADDDAPDDREGGGTLMTIVVGFLSLESMQDHLDMDIEEQMRVTFGQAEALLVG
jgi:hypothetical protein